VVVVVLGLVTAKRATTRRERVGGDAGITWSSPVLVVVVVGLLMGKKSRTKDIDEDWIWVKADLSCEVALDTEAILGLEAVASMT